MGTMTGSRRSGTLEAAADGDWKTTGGWPGLEERRGRRPAVGEAGHSGLRQMVTGRQPVADRGWRRDGDDDR
jgi:hypothetical protein